MVTRLPLAILMISILVIAVIVIGYFISSILHAGRTASAPGRRCANCQKMLPLEAKFCTRCGHQLTAEAGSGSEPTS